MTTIFLHGELAEKFGPVWKLRVRSAGEAIRAIEANKPGLLRYLDESGERGVDFNVKVNGVDTVERDALACRRKLDTIHISPVIRGSKDKWVQVVIGIVLIVVAVYTQQYELLGKGIMYGGEGVVGGWLGTAIGTMGVSLAIGGVANMLASNPRGSSVDDGTQSYLFNGPVNTTTQGGPVPLCYGGPIIVGSQVVSAGIYSEDTTVNHTGGGEPTYPGGVPQTGPYTLDPIMSGGFWTEPTYPPIPDHTGF